MHSPERCKIRSDMADLLSAGSAGAIWQHGFLTLMHCIGARADIQRAGKLILVCSLPELLLNTA